MSDEMHKFLRFLTYATYNELFEIIDIDGIRKPAITTKLVKVNFDKELWSVEIDWRLLDRCRPIRDTDIDTDTDTV